jgi:hypothetical protein
VFTYLSVETVFFVQTLKAKEMVEALLRNKRMPAGAASDFMELVVKLYHPANVIRVRLCEAAVTSCLLQGHLQEALGWGEELQAALLYIGIAAGSAGSRASSARGDVDSSAGDIGGAGASVSVGVGVGAGAVTGNNPAVAELDGRLATIKTMLGVTAGVGAGAFSAVVAGAGAGAGAAVGVGVECASGAGSVGDVRCLSYPESNEHGVCNDGWVGDGWSFTLDGG